MLERKGIIYDSIEKSSLILIKYDVEIINLIKSKRYKHADDTIENRLLSITMQLAIMDLLKEMNVSPNYIIDSSIGQITGAYCEGYIDRHQALSIAYYIAEYIEDINSMKLTSEKHAKDNADISLQKLMKNLDNLDIEPKVFSNKFICFDQEFTQYLYGSSQYFIKTIKSKVNSHQFLHLIPDQSLSIAVSPCNIVNNKNNNGILIGFYHENKFSYKNILSAIGELYCNGYDLRYEVFNPFVSYPVRRGTQSLSPLLRWDHSVDWFVPEYPDYFESNKSVEIIDRKNPEDAHHFNHIVNGVATLSTVSYLLMVWNFLAKKCRKNIVDIPIEFENIIIHREIILETDNKYKFHILYLNQTGNFEFIHRNKLCMSGTVRKIEKYSSSISFEKNKKFDIEQYHLNENQIITELRMRNIYIDKNLTLKKLRIDGKKGENYFDGNLFSYITGALSMKAFCDWSRNPKKVTSLRRMIINPKIILDNDSKRMNIYQNYSSNIIFSENLIIEGLECSSCNKIHENEFEQIIESYKLYAYKRKIIFKYNLKLKYSQENEWLKNIHLQLELFKKLIIGKTSCKTFEIFNINSTETFLLVLLQKIFLRDKYKDGRKNRIKIMFYQSETDNNIKRSPKNIEFDFKKLDSLKNFFIVLLIRSSEYYRFVNFMKDYSLLNEINSNGFTLFLYEKSCKFITTEKHCMDFTDFPDCMENIETLKNILKINRETPRCISIKLVSQNSYNDGLIGMVRCLKKEIDRNFIKLTSFNKFHSKSVNHVSIVSDEIVLKDGQFCNYIHNILRIFEENTKIPSARSQICVEKPGIKCSSDWIIPIETELREKISINIYYSSLNSIDLKLIKSKEVDRYTAGFRTFDNTLGVEFSGRDLSGNRVMGLAKHNAISTHIDNRY